MGTHTLLVRGQTGTSILEKLNNTQKDFPGGPVVKNPPVNAGGRGFDPWSGKIPHVSEQLSPHTPTAEPEPQSPCCVTREAASMRSQCTTTREGFKSQQRPSTAKK